MNSEVLLAELLRFNLIASAAIALVLALRPWVLRRLGARITWWFWLVVPVALGAGLVPAREAAVVVRQPTVSEVVTLDSASAVETRTVATSAAAPVTASPWVALPALADAMVALWLLGAVVLLTRSIVNTRRLARDSSVGPALVGVLRPRLVLPADFATRFDAGERALILAHEEFHRASGHTTINALVEVACCANWFNPLIHLAARRMREDQELACDAAVIAARPTARRAYAQALLKTQVAPAFLPLGCTWTSRSGGLLAQRITLLKQPSLSHRSALAGTALITFVSLVSGYTAWAQQPDRVVAQVAERPQVWTPTAQAPAGTLSHALEGQRHDFFIELARQGEIDFVLFGNTDAEMFWWPARGRPAWDQAFSMDKGANFGAQGTGPGSLLWRMQNGELDGYQAKLVLLQAGFCFGNGAALAGGASDDSAVVVAQCAPIIAEIRARQPQAKVLITPPFPRGQHNLEQWREIATQNVAAFTPLVDDETVFYADFGERFFLADGTYDPLMWSRSGAGAGVGIQPLAFEAWADELQPWLDRFVR